jgi:hypothetical protein
MVGAGVCAAVGATVGADGKTEVSKVGDSDGSLETFGDALEGFEALEPLEGVVALEDFVALELPLELPLELDDFEPLELFCFRTRPCPSLAMAEWQLAATSTRNGIKRLIIMMMISIVIPKGMIFL